MPDVNQYPPTPQAHVRGRSIVNWLCPVCQHEVGKMMHTPDHPGDFVLTIGLMLCHPDGDTCVRCICGAVVIVWRGRM